MGGIRRATRVAVLAVLVVVGVAVAGDVANAEPTPVKIMPLGDSITEAFDTIPESMPTYRRYLHDSLVAQGIPVDFVGSRNGVLDGDASPDGMADPGGAWDKDHEGHSGWRADEIVNGKYAGHGKLSQWLAAENPDVVLIHLGTNDIRQGEPTAQIVADLENVIGTIRSARADTKIVLTTLIGSKRASDQTAIDALNAEIPGLVSRLTTSTSPIELALAGSWYSPHGMNFDKLHPNPTGQQHIADAFLRVLKRMDLTPSPTSSTTTSTSTSTTSTSTTTTSTPTTSTSTTTSTSVPGGGCPVVGEATAGTRSGTMVVSSLSGATGGTVVSSPEKSGNGWRWDQMPGTVDVCVSVPAAGSYSVQLSGRGRVDWSDEVWVLVDGSNADWTELPPQLGTVRMSQVFSLAAGQHVITVGVREDGADIDTVTFVPA